MFDVKLMLKRCFVICKRVSVIENQELLEIIFVCHWYLVERRNC